MDKQELYERKFILTNGKVCRNDQTAIARESGHMAIFCDRKYKLWFYQVTHREAIIRSSKTDGNKIYDKNIDIYLGDIDYIEMPCILPELQIDKATQEDAAYLRQKCNKDIPAEKIVVFISEGRRYYVVASIIKIMENDLDYAVLPICAFIKNSQE